MTGHGPSHPPQAPAGVSAAPGFGPWRPDLDPVERLARLRELRAIVFMLCGPEHPLVIALRDAEADPAAAARALAQLETLPALRRRRVLATYAALQKPSDRVALHPRYR